MPVEHLSFFRKEAFIFSTLLCRAYLVCAIILTIALLWASIVPVVGQGVGPGYHRSLHLISFAVLAFTWRGALAQMSVLIIALYVIGFGVLQEVIEIFGHGHSFEIHDVVIDMFGVLIGAALAQLGNKFPRTK